ncbi:Tctex1 domain-containing protein 2 [Neocallimastix lanati (nom. inval.)]|uniref:Tctex1 domain-containing protein 2 n=1 Tax=Neocallimastix californiae TaxID=1754190 RepID=A0A1Y2A4V5_9FUNG|nr:Tctex1 domain-containing protein 2 [Neocallimastix sp. JGI-2020a]ORY17549.1 Tctex1 domain-containing protein 2 [Neocallimastix californiae]|eukprot:ORY17549.1 Tctex1 domain-containing protein 2 [Neocallimastix californiae]
MSEPYNSISENANDENYSIRPNFQQKFRPSVVQKIIHEVLVEKLKGQSYSPETCSTFTKEIADQIKNKLKELELPRYKYVVNVVLGEMKGEGARMACRCLWDSDTDNLAQDIYTNETLFCVAVAFGVFYY